MGRCENNMAMWCQTEGDYEEAANRLKVAMDIKFSLGDVGGGINQLSALLQIYTVLLGDLEEAKKLACYAEQHMPLYADKTERYILCYSLALYKLRIGDYASTLVYGRKAKDGLPYLPKAYSVYEKIVQSAASAQNRLWLPAFSHPRQGQYVHTELFFLCLAFNLKKLWMKRENMRLKTHLSEICVA